MKHNRFLVVICFSVAVVLFSLPGLSVAQDSMGNISSPSIRGYNWYRPYYSELCFVPYNISIAGYTTGLHFTFHWTSPVTITVDFWSGGKQPYATRTLEIADGTKGWTGTLERLLETTGQSPRFPTQLIIFSHRDSEEPGHSIHFDVVQFLFTDSGFSHCVFNSHKVVAPE
jgi:hypothetical protein